MADLGCTYTLSTGTGNIDFNDGDLFDGQDKYWITNVEGLDGAPLRTPQDNAPFSDGGLVYNFWEGARHPVFEGVLITESLGFPAVGDDCIILQNEMEEDLIDALKTIERADGTLTWTPLGLNSRTLTVRYEVPVVFSAIEDYRMKHFVFGLVAADPNW